MFAQKTLCAFGTSFEDGVDIGVAQAPRVGGIRGHPLFINGDQTIAQPVQGLPQGGTPHLMPSALAPRGTPAVGTPALNAVSAAPGTVCNDLDLMGDGELFQE